MVDHLTAHHKTNGSTTSWPQCLRKKPDHLDYPTILAAASSPCNSPFPVALFAFCLLQTKLLRKSHNVWEQPIYIKLASPCDLLSQVWGELYSDRIALLFIWRKKRGHL